MTDYDLAGNPLPDRAQPQSRTPEQYDLAGNPMPSNNKPASMADTQYDLAGNPLPARPTPPQGMYHPSGNPPPQVQTPPHYANTQSRPGYQQSPYQNPGQSQGYQQPQYPNPGQQSGNYHNPGLSSQPYVATVPAGMQEAVAKGANWIWLIAGLSVLSTLLFNFRIPYVSSIGLRGPVFVAELLSAASMPYMACVLVGIVLVTPFVLFALQGAKTQTWAFAAAMIVYAIDMPLVLLHLSIFGIIWHCILLARLFSAFTACREIVRTSSR